VPVRLAAVCALRRQASEAIGAFLDDPDPLVVLEAARAIHDVPISGAMPSLAEMIKRESVTRSSDDDALLRRVLNANFRVGQPDNAKSLANFAARETVSPEMRREAIEMLGDWQAPHGRDRVLGMWRPLDERDPAPVVEALRPLVAQLADADAGIRLGVARIAGKFGISEAAPILETLIAEQSVRPSQRVDALRSLAELTGEDSVKAVRGAIHDDNEQVRAAGLELLAKFDPVAAMPWLTKAAQDGQLSERQAAITALGELEIDQAHEPLLQLMEELNQGHLAPEVHLETLAAAAKQDNDQLRSLLAAYEAQRDTSQPADQYRETLYGGNAVRGRQIFHERPSVSCLRCHKVYSRGGEVGPELTRIAAEKDRHYLLESIVDPNRAIAKGFESALVLTDGGQTYVGVVKEETDTDLTLMDAEANPIVIKKDSIELRKPSKSAMPEDVVKQLTKAELRDLIEYLASLDGLRRFRGFNRRAVQ
jgi:quinoprotein glucose dehydrogenase